jgi:thioredoxin
MENLTVETFKEKVYDYTQSEEWSFKGEKPAIIDFYADWCEPCKTIAPLLEELDGEYKGVDFYKVDTEVENELATRFGIQSIPSLLFIPLEGSPQMAMGALPKHTFKQAIDTVLLGIESKAESEPEKGPEQDEKEEKKE